MQPRRGLKPWSLVGLALNGIVGVGIFFAPSTLARDAPGSWSVWALAVTPLSLLPVALTLGALARRFPEDGGIVVYAARVFGERVGLWVGLLAYAGAVTSTTAVLAGLGEAVAASWQWSPVWGGRLGALVALIATLLAMGGIAPSARIWSALALAKVGFLLLLVALAVWELGGLFPGQGALASDTSLLRGGEPLRAWLSATFLFQGFEIMPLVAGQTRHPRHVTWAMVGALVIAAVLYMSLQIACLLGVADLADSREPLVELGARLVGADGAPILRIALDGSALGLAFGMLVMTPRYLAAVAERAGPRWGWLARQNPRGVPAFAALVSLGLTVLLLGRDFGSLMALSSLSIVWMFAAAAVVQLRMWWRDPGPRRAVRVLPALASLAVASVLSLGARWDEALVLLGAMLLAGALSLLLGKRAQGSYTSAP